MKAKLPENLHPKIDAILERMTNLVSVIHHHLYFPIYSNGLKQIGRFLKYGRSGGEQKGLQSIVWRKSWEENQLPDLKARLLEYNEDDCRELRHVAEFVKQTLPPDTF